jgi:hypothetical protein
LFASVAVTVNVDVPLTELVPVIAPPVLNVSPVGRLPDVRLYVYGPVPAEAVIDWL